MNIAAGALGAAAPHEHDHVFLGAGHDENARKTKWVVVLTAGMMVIEIVAGYVTGSMALLADGFHIATHAGALGMAALAYSYARRNARNPQFTFGTGKVGDLAGFATALVLAMVALGIGVESAGRLLTPASVHYTEAIWIAVLGLIVNIASVLLLGHGHDHDHHHDHGHDQRPEHHHDNNLRSAYFHVLADALTSVLAIVALVAGLYLGWRWMDPFMGIVGAVVIARWSWGLLRDTGMVLVDAAANPSLEGEIREAIEDSETKITDLHVWRVGPGKFAAIVSLISGRPLTPSEYAARVLIHEELVHVTIEPNPA